MNMHMTVHAQSPHPYEHMHYKYMHGHTMHATTHMRAQMQSSICARINTIALSFLTCKNT